MSATLDGQYNGFCSKINDKHVDAIGHMVFRVDFDHLKSPFQVEKVFGLLLGNLVLKFKLFVKETDQEKIKFKLLYVNEEPIVCKFECSYLELQEEKHLSIGNELVNFDFAIDELKHDPQVMFCIGLSFDILCQMKHNLISNSNLIASMFNDRSDSDLIIECQNEKFHVHQMILKFHSEYFEAILGNNCKGKKLTIDDFEPKVVKIFLRHIYNGGLRDNDLDDINTAISLMKIAEKYNSASLFDTIDSRFAQVFLRILWSSLDRTAAMLKLDYFLQICEKTGSPKLSTMIFSCTRTWKKVYEISDDQMTNLIKKNPNFAKSAMISFSRTDYTSWVKQHISWGLYKDRTEKMDFALIVGMLGEMVGATKCYPI